MRKRKILTLNGPINWKQNIGRQHKQAFSVVLSHFSRIEYLKLQAFDVNKPGIWDCSSLYFTWVKHWKPNLTQICCFWPFNGAVLVDILCYCSHCIGTCYEYAYHVISLLYSTIITQPSKCFLNPHKRYYTFNLTAYEGNHKSHPPNLEKRSMDPNRLLDDSGMVIESLHKCSIIPILKQVHWLTLKWHWALQGQRYTIYVLWVPLSYKFTPFCSTTKPVSSYKPVCYKDTEWLQNSLD